jgi:glycosyltransferase involved in cell wall biosynthesis
MTTNGRRVAFLTHTPPLPLWSGERIRSWHLVRELARHGWNVALFSLVHAGTAPSATDCAQLEEVCDEVVLMPFTVPGSRRRARLAADIARGRPFQARYFLDKPAAARARELLAGGFDVIVISQLYMAPYVPNELLPRALLDSHNSESRRLATMDTALGISGRGIAARLQRVPVARYERLVAEQVARICAVSELDAAYFEALAPGRVDLVPNGVDCEGIAARSAVPPDPRLLFVGSLDYAANVDAVSWLARDVLRRVPSGVMVDVVGSNPRRAVHRAAARSPVPVRVAGQVPDTGPYWARARVFIVPLRVGGGTRLKILEALARGVPVVSTSIGCEGLDLRHGEDLLVADDAAAFAASVARLLGDDELCASLARHGRATVEARYDWRAIGDGFHESVARVVGG